MNLYFHKHKNLLRTVQHISNIKLIVVGDGDLKQYYINVAKELLISKKVIFTGKVGDKELSHIYNLCDLYILPSVDKTEAFGLVLLETMASAKPVIATNLGGIRSVADNHENGILIESNNTQDLTEKIIYLLNRKELCLQYGAKGLKIVNRKYAWGQIVLHLLNIYKKT